VEVEFDYSEEQPAPHAENPSQTTFANPGEPGHFAITAATYVESGAAIKLTPEEERKLQDYFYDTVLPAKKAENRSL